MFTKTILKRVETTEDMVKEINEPLTMEGYILDIDDKFLYIGDSSQEICSAVKHDDYSSVHIVRPVHPFDNFLDGMPEPEEDKDIN